MHIHSILSDKGTDVAAIGPSVSASHAARTMATHNVGALLIVDEDERIVGIVSERDLARAMGTTPTAGDVLVSTLMASEVITCLPGDTIDSVMHTMSSHRIRHVPVVDEQGHLAGIVSIGDVVKRRIDEMAAETAALHEYIEVGR